jgi:predicted DNA-binding ribbon-helix-helix protein
MKSVVTKLSIVIDGRKTNFRLEDAFWTALKEIAHYQRITPSNLVVSITVTRKQSNLSSAIRGFVLEYFQNEGKRACTLVPA